MAVGQCGKFMQPTLKLAKSAWGTFSPSRETLNFTSKVWQRNGKCDHNFILIKFNKLKSNVKTVHGIPPHKCKCNSNFISGCVRNLKNADLEVERH